jgi:DNA-binding MarR family transcriptional regulator
MPSPDDPCFCTALREAALAATEVYDRALKPSGLKLTMFRLLRRAAEAGTPTISELADIVHLDRSTLGRNLRVLERRKLIKLNSGEDERSKMVVLTATGRAALTRALPLWRTAQDDMAKVFGTESRTLAGTLSKVSAHTAAQANAKAKIRKPRPAASV